MTMNCQPGSFRASGSKIISLSPASSTYHKHRPLVLHIANTSPHAVLWRRDWRPTFVCHARLKPDTANLTVSLPNFWLISSNVYVKRCGLLRLPRARQVPDSALKWPGGGGGEREEREQTQ